MTRGREIHAALASFYSGDPLPDILMPWGGAIKAMWADDCIGSGVEVEVPITRDGAAFQLKGTLDLVITRGDPMGSQHTIVDWKTGHESPGDAGECVQLYAYAWIDYCEGVAQTIELRWLKDDGTVDVSSVEVGADEIAAFGAELEAITGRLAAGGIEPVPGEHCERCPARINCPAHNTLLARAAGGMGIDFDARSILARGIQSDAEARGVYHAINAVKYALPMFEEHLRAYLREHGRIEVNPGVYVMVSTQTRRAVLDTPQAMAIIRSHLSEAARTAGMDVDAVLSAALPNRPVVTIGGLEKAAAMCGDGARKRLFEALSELGIVEKRQSMSLRTVKDGWANDDQ